MDTKVIIKWALIGVGAYLVYQWVKSSGWLGTTPAVSAATNPLLTTTVTPTGQVVTQVPVAPGVTTPVTQVVAPVSVPAPTPAPASIAPTDYNAIAAAANQGVSIPDDKALMTAALYNQSSGITGNYRLNAWQWNFYRKAAAEAYLGGSIPEQHYPDLSTVTNMAQMMTAAEYHYALGLANANMSGLGWGGGSGYRLGYGGGGVQ